MLWKRTLAALAITGAIAFTTAAHAQTTLRSANMGEPASLDPHFISGVWENRITGDLFLGLTTESAEGKVIPGAAEKWSISPDGKTYTFTIRDHKWSDGQPVTAGDFDYALHRILAPETPAKYASLLYPILNAEKFKKGETKELGVRAVDAKTLQITLANPTPFFLALLTHYTAFPVPKHVVEKFGKDWVKPGNFVSNGAYVMTEWQANDHIKAIKNANFYDAANVKIDNILWYPGEDRAAAARRFRAGEIDMATDFASDQLDQLRRDLPKETRISPYLGIYYYAFNTQKKPFDDKRVRQALSMAIDRSVITDLVLKSGELPGWSFVPPGTDNYTAEPAYVSFKNMTQADRDKRAKELMTQAGFTTDKPLKLTIAYNTSENHKLIAIAIQSMWKAVGVQAELFNTEVAVHYNNMQQGNFDVGRAGWIADYNDPQNFLYLMQTSTGPINYAHYSNADYDKLMDEAARTTDLEVRADLMKKAEAIAMEELPNIPIYYYVSKNLVSSKLNGWVANTKDIHRTRWMSFAN
jgi:oligopeptide transport system substrate-binding protein